MKDLDELMSARTKAMKDPISFVAQLQNGDLPELSSPQNIAKISYVDWSQYNILSNMYKMYKICRKLDMDMFCRRCN